MSLIILDYGAGNIRSVANLLDVLEIKYKISDKKEDLINAERIIFPGVGHFAQVMDALNSRGLTQPLIDTINTGTPFLGICLGLQVLFEESQEAPGIKGLGILPGKVLKFKWGKIPHIGWNKLDITDNNSLLTNDYVYFVNSFYAVPDDTNVISAYSNYYMNFTAAVEHDNITAFQFHPERSGKTGEKIFKNWLEVSAKKLVAD